MADTIQVVNWALEQTCLLRSADTVASPGKAHVAVAEARTYADAALQPPGRTGVFGDVCVTGYSASTLRLDKLRVNGPIGEDVFVDAYPESGFLLSTSFAATGGVDGLKAMCGNCPANASCDRRPAQCVGRLYLHRGTVEPQLRRIIERAGLAADVAEVFEDTTPLFFGFWTRSPLTPPALHLLRRILTDLHDEDAATPDRDGFRIGSHLRDLSQLIRAAGVALNVGLPLHAHMSPPGHTDFGFYTTFPHCPNCKAEADLERWKHRYPKDLRACRVCGAVYSPAATASTRRDDHDGTTLRDVLGEERFRAFAIEYLVAQGKDRTEAVETVQRKEAEEVDRRAYLAAMRERGRRESDFVRDVLYVGLHPTHAPEDTSDPPETRTSWLDAGEFAVLLERARARGGRINFMAHLTPDGDVEPRQLGWIDLPEQLLRQWRNAGHHGRFTASFHVPDDTLGWSEPPS